MADNQSPHFENIGFGAENYAPYASLPSQTRGRLINEDESPTRTPYQRDRDRIVHSTAFRRLKHKTQVFIHHEGDHFRTRLTHTIEVAQIARAIARALRLNEDLAEALALAHDLGHTPFGHAGEDGLAHAMRHYGGFEHNAQTLRLVTKLERRYAAFDGLNLTWEMLEGIVKHNGPLTTPDGAPVGRYVEGGLPHAINVYNSSHDLNLHTYAGLEAQAAAIADDIAYNAHDIDDGLRQGVLAIETLNDVPLVRELLAEVRNLYPDLDEARTTHEIVRRVITRMIEDVISTSTRNLATQKPQHADDVRCAKRSFVHFSEAMATAEKGIKQFLFQNMYHGPQIMKIRDNAETIVVDLFDKYFANPENMSDQWTRDAIAVGRNELKRARLICDYVAGMTDRFAVLEHQRLFDVTPDLR